MNEFDYMFSNIDYETLMMIGGVVVVVGLIALVIGVVCYILTASAMHTIGKRRGINNAWMAWIPGVNSWILGSISDQYQYVVKGKVRYNRIILIALWGATIVMSGVSTGMMDSTSNALGILGGSFISSIISIAYTVFHYISLYDLYTSCNPNNNVLFLVLSIVFGITEPFFVFSCRNKDLGMPPRKQTYHAQNAYQTYAPTPEQPQIPQENNWQSQSDSQNPSDPWDNSNN